MIDLTGCAKDYAGAPIESYSGGLTSILIVPIALSLVMPVNVFLITAIQREQ